MKSNKSVKRNNAPSKAAPVKGNPPVALSGVVRSKTPRFGGSGAGSGITIHRREFAGTATNGALTTFVLSSLSSSTPGYDINPCCKNLFPWLSGLATNYERYRFKSLKFEIIPSQATTSAGRYYCAVDYDYDDAPASNKAELMGNHSAVEAPVWERSVLVCDPSCLNRDMPFRYVSCSTRGYDFEPRTTFSGFFMVGFDTTVANCLLDIWVEYDVELATPVYESANSTLVDLSGHTATTNITAAAGTAYFGALNTTTPTKSGPVVKVVAGSGNVPSMVVSVGGANKAVNEGLDVSLTGFRGSLDIMADVAVTGVAPSAIIGTNQLDLKVAVYDSSGSYLGEAYSATTETQKTVGPKTLSELSTVDKYVRYLVSLGMEELRKYMPTARFLMPYVTSTVAALGAGYQAFGWHYSDL